MDYLVGWTRWLAAIVFGYIALQIAGGLVSANIRAAAQRYGHDQYVVRITEWLRPKVRWMRVGWRVVKGQWWVWLCLGLSLGVGVVPEVEVLLSGNYRTMSAQQPLISYQPRATVPPPVNMAPEEDATRLSIWDSVGKANHAALVNGLNQMEAAVDRWPNLVKTPDGRRQLYQDIINATASYRGASDEIESLRAQYPAYQDVEDTLRQPNRAALVQASEALSSAIIRIPPEITADDEVKLRPLVGALQREMDQTAIWLKSLQTTAQQKRAQLSR